MNEVLHLEEIEQCFTAEWVLLEAPATAPLHQIISGKVLWHSKDRDELYAKALELRPQHAAILYTGSIPASMAIVL
jgi:hypothetical protein